MESAPKILITKEDKERQLKGVKEFKFNMTIDKDTFQLKLAETKDNNSIIIQVCKINQLSYIFYESILSFDDFIKLDKIFSEYDELDEILLMIVNCFQEKKILIKEVKDNELQLGIKIISIKGKEKIVDINLNKIEIKQNSIIKYQNKNFFKKEEINLFYNISFGKEKNKWFKIKPIKITKKTKSKMIKLEYKYNNKEKNISLLGKNFIKSNKNKCFIIINNKQYSLTNNIKELKEKIYKLIQIKLRILENIIDLNEMFFESSSLISLCDISKLNINNVINMGYLFFIKFFT